MDSLIFLSPHIKCTTELASLLLIKGREAIKKRWILPEGVSVPQHKISHKKNEPAFNAVKLS